jgi:aspartate racemase
MTLPALSRRYAPRAIGVIGGLGPLAAADVFFKLVRSTPASSDAEHLDVVFEQRPHFDSTCTRAATTARKLYVFDMLRAFEARGLTIAVLPCFLSHTFIDELRANTTLQIVDMVEAMRACVARRFAHARRIGVLTSDVLREAALFERYFAPHGFEVLHPRPDAAGVDRVTQAVYGRQGIKAGCLSGEPVALLRAACEDLVAQGAEVIVPGLTEVSLVADTLDPFETLGATVIDSNLEYALHVLACESARRTPPFKVGIVGGVGPAATVDFMQKMIGRTHAHRDQDHIKLLVEHNPQIPDRTEHLLGGGEDPTVSLYATCKKLEAGGADIIAIPCNTAHAFVERIERRLQVPIVHMPEVTAAHLRARFPGLREVGVLATTGTLASGVYAAALNKHGLQQVAPTAQSQARVMDAIYGARGVKAGYTDGICIEDLNAALDDLLARGVRVVLLGCTELPLLLRGERVKRNGREAALVDPTDILARACVARAQAAREVEGR